ncbi:MAG: DnaJ domain-containing protein [Clostridia bacterium]
MRDPYDVLGISRSANATEIKAAYRKLAKQYHPDRYINSPLAESANAKMQEINEAYDAIISGNAGNSHQGYSAQSNSNINYQVVENYIATNRFDDAELELDRVTENARDAHWYYMKGKVNYSRGWSDQAFTYYSTAYKMNPQNDQYKYAYQNLKTQRSGGFRTQETPKQQGNGCSSCDVCTGLLCADCCCECMGGDLIGCC